MSEFAPARYESLIRDHVAECWNNGNYEHLTDHFALDVLVIHFGMPHRGPEHVRDIIEDHRERFKDFHLEIDEFVVSQTTATIYWTFSGIYSAGGWFGGGEEIEVSGKSTIEFTGNKISLVHGLPNRIDVLRASRKPI